MQAPPLSRSATPGPVFVLDGDLDIGTRHRLRQRLDEARVLGGPALTVDASAVTFIDCGSLRLLVDAKHKSRDAGGSLTVVQPSSCVVRLARLAGFDTLITDPAA